MYDNRKAFASLFCISPMGSLGGNLVAAGLFLALAAVVGLLTGAALVTVVAAMDWTTAPIALLAQVPLISRAPLTRDVRYRPLETVTRPASAVPSPPVDLLQGGVLHSVLLRLTGTVTVAGGTTDGTLAAEQPLSILREIRVEASSSIRPEAAVLKRMDGGSMFRLMHRWNGIAGELTALTIAGVQTATVINATWEIPFYSPHSEADRVTLLNTLELNTLNLILEWGDATDIIVGGDRTVTLNSFQIAVTLVEFNDPAILTDEFGLFINRMDEIARNSQANSADRFRITKGNLLRALFIKQFTQAGTVHTPVDTLFTGVRVEINREPIIRYDAAALLRAQMLRQFRVANSAGYLLIDLMGDDKRFDRLINSNLLKEGQNVELVSDIASVANARYRVHPLEIIQRPGAKG